MSDQTRYDEFHQNMEEFWEYAGTAKSKRRKSAAAKRRSAANETVKALSTASAVVVTEYVVKAIHNNLQEFADATWSRPPVILEQSRPLDSSLCSRMTERTAK